MSQEEINKRNEELFVFYEGKDKEQIKAIEKAVKILVDADIYFYLFPMINDGDGKECVWQWNSIGELSGMAHGKKPDVATFERIKKFHIDLLWNMYAINTGNLDYPKWEEFKQMMIYYFGEDQLNNIKVNTLGKVKREDI